MLIYVWDLKTTKWFRDKWHATKSACNGRGSVTSPSNQIPTFYFAHTIKFPRIRIPCEVYHNENGNVSILRFGFVLFFWLCCKANFLLLVDIFYCYVHKSPEDLSEIIKFSSSNFNNMAICVQWKKTTTTTSEKKFRFEIVMCIALQIMRPFLSSSSKCNTYRNRHSALWDAMQRFTLIWRRWLLFCVFGASLFFGCDVFGHVNFYAAFVVVWAYFSLCRGLSGCAFSSLWVGCCQQLRYRRTCESLESNIYHMHIISLNSSQSRIAHKIGLSQWVGYIYLTIQFSVACSVFRSLSLGLASHSRSIKINTDRIPFIMS